MSPPRPVPLLGRIAIHLKLITHDQLAEATQQQERDGHQQNLGELLMERGLIDAGQLRPRTADDYAATDGVRILSLSEGTIRKMIDSDPSVAARLLLNISKILCLRVLKSS